ncbi:hypothetical protein GWC95_08370 [Sediminibacterium roseum]|uniref:Tetratricopeptide repeat protein n=1 Tax=Sediminibacterium roseum TaxID=1978412 RepID=A0ABW9ZV89_9BACT|nr:hypothetical protein [Sediminibacterium roseum]NCI49933.1 hypothetical protein [Sediminibacterium roseum]
MNVTQEKSLFHLTGKLALSQAAKETLQAVADESPYFAPARFLLTADLKLAQPYHEWMAHAQKTNLYFTNPNWLQYLLEDITTEPLKEKVTDGPTPAAITDKASAMAIPTVESVKEAMRRIDPTQEDPDETEELMPDAYAETDLLTEEADSKISGLLSSQLADFKKPVAAGDVLDIEAEKKPLHTVDYFVSQGIKVDLSAMPQDKLTTHLRKFTDWLKQIKTANANPQDLGTNLEMEKAVAETAKNSNETREIVTESMADVLVKQGQAEKAIQLYIKLSFLNPEKSSYFAAKIEQLKGI